MTKRKAAIVSAYTGYLIGEFSDFQAYAKEIMGRPIFTHELPKIVDELKEKSKKGFMSIRIENEDKKKKRRLILVVNSKIGAHHILDGVKVLIIQTKDVFRIF